MIFSLQGSFSEIHDDWRAMGRAYANITDQAFSNVSNQAIHEGADAFLAELAQGYGPIHEDNKSHLHRT